MQSHGEGQTVTVQATPKTSSVNLGTEEHLGAEFRALNPQGLVPALIDNGTRLIQSPAIIEWLEERFPGPPLLPSEPLDRARVRALAAVVGCDIHPINSLGCDEAAVLAWCETWIRAGFDALEALLAEDPNRGRFCFGDRPTLADVYLVPQVESARRFDIDLGDYPAITAVDAACAQLDAFRLAAPAFQPDNPARDGT